MGDIDITSDVIEAEDIFNMLSLFGINVVTVTEAELLIQFAATIDVSDGADSTEITAFLTAVGVDTTGLDIDTIVDTVNAELNGDVVDYTTIFATTIYNSLAIVGITDITEADIAAYLAEDPEFDPFSIEEEDVLEFFTAMGIDTTTLDQTLLLEALSTIGVDLVPTAAEIQTAVKDILGITLKTN